MRKIAMIAALAMSLGLVGLTASAEESDDRDEFYQEACETMAWQFDDARVVRQNHPNFLRSLALRDQGVSRCEYGHQAAGSVLLRTALQDIDVYPLH